MKFLAGAYSHIRHRLLLIFTLGFAGGVILVSTVVTLPWFVYAAVGAASLAALFVFQRANLLFLALLGIAFGALRSTEFYPPGWNVDAYASPSPISIFGIIASDPVADPNNASFLLTTQIIRTHKATYLSRGTTEVLIHGAAMRSYQNEACGDLVWVSGMLQQVFPVTNPGEYDWRTHLIRRGVSGELIVQRPYGIRLMRPAGPLEPLLVWSRQTEKRLELSFAGSLPPDEDGLVNGVLFGDRSLLSPLLQREFAATGTAHVLATAGLHVGILAICIGVVLSLVSVPRKIAVYVIIPSLWIFAALAGDRPAILRAVLAATIYFAARIFERAPDLPTTFSAAALSILAIQPPALLDSDFQLSFVTVAGLAASIPTWDDLWRPKLDTIRLKWVKRSVNAGVELAGLSIFAQLFSAPLTVYYFSQLSLLSLPVNLIVVPLLFVTIPVAVVTLFLCASFPVAGTFCLHFLLHPLLRTILRVVEWFYQSPICSVAVPPFSIVVVLGIYLAAFTLMLLASGEGKRKAVNSTI